MHRFSKAASVFLASPRRVRHIRLRLLQHHARAAKSYGEFGQSSDIWWGFQIFDDPWLDAMLLQQASVCGICCNAGCGRSLGSLT